MDPLVRFRDAHSKGLIPDDIYDLTLKRFPLVVAGINRIEKASGIQYPVAYVEPSLVLSSSNSNSYEYGILFARTIPVMFEEKFQVVIQITAPLIAYGLKGTIHAILAHEFLQFLELVRKISKMELISDEISGNLFILQKMSRIRSGTFFTELQNNPEWRIINLTYQCPAKKMLCKLVS